MGETGSATSDQKLAQGSVQVFGECLPWVAVSMGRRNTRMKPRRLDFGFQSLLGLSEKLAQQWSSVIE